MATPLSPSADEVLNCPPPASAKRYGGEYGVQSFRKLSVDMDYIDEASSPINLETTDVLNMSDQENVLPSRRSHSRVISGTELSPLKILNRKRSSPDSGLADLGAMPPPPLRCARRVSPEKRFPVKVSGSGESMAEHQRKISLESLLHGNDALKQAIDIFEDELSSGDHDNDNDAAADDTMMSAFSTFSAMPDMATLSKLGHSPAKLSGLRGIPPRVPSATGSRPSTRDEANSSNLLMDYTDSLRNPKRSPDKRGTLPASFSTNHVESTPNRKTLMDFDIPPMPTPRSVPSISARELESLKSSFMSEISSLKASLSGKEAEVRSLKSAVGDAEKRVGETMEQFRDEQALKEQLSHEKDDWENRSRELERVLSKARSDIEASHQEREDLEQKLDESEKRREAAETLHQEAESKIAGMRAGKSSEQTSLDNRQDAASTNKEVEVAVERVARELHTLYKGKHETKVAALKKSYEARWEKKIRELEARVSQLTEENQLLEANAHSPIHAAGSGPSDELRDQAVRDSAAIKELRADVQRLEAMAASTRKDNEELHLMLERERVEKGELVQLAEELMSIQHAPPPQIPARADRSGGAAQRAAPAPEPVMPAKTPAKTPRRSDVRASMGRASGLRTPGSSLRQPRTSAPPARQSLGGSRLSMGGSSARAGVMANIERMGQHRREQHQNQL